MKGRVLRFDYPRSKTRTDIHVALYERSLSRVHGEEKMLGRGLWTRLVSSCAPVQGSCSNS